ncbi:MAG: PDZ domain-containing protein [Solirubrobacterales bacterium]|nr:PDZ domain-containing protein [Solirubrobacterales bacterium]
MRRRLPGLVVAALAAATLGLGACGDDSSDGTSTVVSTTTSEATTTPAGQARRASVIESAGGPFDSQEIYAKAAPGVVTVLSVLGGGSGTDLFGGGGRSQGQGSGFVISDAGEILTNAHVVTDASTTGTQSGPLQAADEVYVQFADHNQVEARIVGFDPFADVALLRVDPDGLDLRPLPLGSENDVAVGQGVAAIGSPFGQEQSLSVGVVSATDRTIDSLTQFGIDGAIQTDASINPGNSGGPLLDAAGEVVGINQQINTTSGGNEGVGFAVPIDLAERAIGQLRDGGSVSYAYAGVSTRPLYPQLADELGIDADTGAIVASVQPNSPASEAGLQAGDEPVRFQGLEYKAGGDVIVAVDGEEIQANSDLPRMISLLDPGDVVTLDVVRDGERQQIELTLGERPDDVEPQGPPPEDPEP